MLLGKRSQTPATATSLAPSSLCTLSSYYSKTWGSPGGGGEGGEKRAKPEFALTPQRGGELQA